MTQCADDILVRNVPPHSMEAEQAIVGAVLARADLLDDLRDTISAGDFYSPAHSKIFLAICELADASQPVDMLTVGDKLSAQDCLDEVGGPVYLADLADTIASPSSVSAYARTVRDRAARRAMAQSAAEILQDSYSLATPTDEIAAKAAKIAEDGITGAVGDGSSTVSMGDALTDFVQWCEHSRAAKDDVMVPTPWQALNRLMGGFHPGEVTVLAGRPSNGKTAAALNVALYAARRDCPTAVISLEMSRRMLLARMCAGEAEIDGRRFRTGQIDDADMGRVYRWCDNNAGLPLNIFDGTDLKPSSLRALTKRWVKRFGVRLIVIDYLQLIKPQTPNASREVQVAEISRAVKEIAINHDVHVLLLAQMNREVEKRTKREPQLSDLRESGAIEQDADNVLFIHPWNPDTQINTIPVKLKLAKARNDCTGVAELVYVRPRLRFADQTFGGHDA